MSPNPIISFLETFFQCNGNRFDKDIVVSVLIGNHIDVILWLFHKHLVTPEDAFIYCCEIGQIVIAKWLLVNYYSEINTVMIHERAFLRSCETNQHETAKWLLDMFPFLKSSSQKYQTFYGVCFMGNLDIAKWLLTIWPNFDLRFNDCELFRMSCIYGHIEIAKWLHSICGNIRAKGDSAFTYTNNTEVVLWLTTLCENYFIVVDDNMKIKSRMVFTDQELAFKKKQQMKIKLLQSKMELLQQSGDELSIKKIEVVKLKIDAINKKL